VVSRAPALARAFVLDVTPRRKLALAADVRGCAVDCLSSQSSPLRRVDLSAAIDDDGVLGRFECVPDPPIELLGRTAGRGFRAALQPLTESGPTGRLLRRMLWDLPILAQVAGQTALLDHDAARAEMTFNRRGTDQCSGWRADGEMMRRVDGNAGILVMPLGPRTTHSLTERWIGRQPALAPMATRRERVLEVGSRDPAGLRDLRGQGPVTVRYRDSYADPDGLSRALHEWTVHTVLADSGLGGSGLAGSGDARFGKFAVEAGRLPWVECPAAGLSAHRLDGHAMADVEQMIGAGFAGISTCTHLNDTLRGLAELPDLIASLESSQTR
jgi:hypothetical protein